jgi:hypothetical protein
MKILNRFLRIQQVNKKSLKHAEGRVEVELKEEEINLKFSLE